MPPGNRPVPQQELPAWLIICIEILLFTSNARHAQAMENAGQSSESDSAKKGGLWDALAYFGKDLILVEAIGHPAGRAVR
jgi:hypothetical protein